MKRVLAIALALLMIPAPVAAQDGEDEWPPWFEPEEFTARVPLEIGLGDHYPSDWDGPRLVTHELDATQALIDAGWPTDAATGLPQSFTVDEDSVRVVSDAETGPIPAITWPGSLLSGPGAFPTGHEVLTVAFLVPEDVSDVHIYFDRTEDGASQPLQVDPVDEARIMQLLAGPGSGHELYGVVDGTGVNVLVTGASSTKITAERLTSQGWSSFGCSGQTVGPSAGSWARCTVSSVQGPAPIRIVADKPIASYLWTGEERFTPLTSTQGTMQGQRLTVPHVQGTDTTIVKLVGVSDSCPATVGSQQVTVPVGTPTTVEISGPVVVDADCEVLGWIPGAGPASTPVSIEAGFTTAVASNQGGEDSQDLVATGAQGARTTLINFNKNIEQTKLLLEGTSGLTGQPYRGASWAMTGEEEPYTLQTEATSLWASIWEDPGSSQGVVPLYPSVAGTAAYLGKAAEGTEVQLVGLTRAGDSKVAMAAEGDRISSQRGTSQAFSFGPGEDRVPTDGGLVEAWTQDTRLLFAYALLGNGEKAPTMLSSFLRPLATTEGTPQAIGPLFELALDPESRIGAPGEVHRFDLLGSGAIRNPDGTLTELEIQLNVQAATDSLEAPELDLDLQPDARVTLPQEDPDVLGTVVVTVPPEIPPGAKPIYTILAAGTPVDGGDAIEARASLQIIPERQISLTFEDGSSLKDFQTDEGEVTAPLILENTGTDDEPVALSTTLPAATGWEVELLDASSRTPVSELDLGPGAQRRLLLHVTTDTEGPLILNVKASARSLLDASTTSDVTARVAHGVSMDLSADVVPDLVNLQRGERATVNLTLQNEGSPVNVKINPRELPNLIAEAGTTSQNLGEPGTGTSQATVPVNLTVGPQAPLGGVLVLTVELEIQLGELEPITQLLSVRVAVVPEHGLEPASALSALPGLRQELELAVQATGDADEDVTLDLLEVPDGWEVELPGGLQVPVNTTAPLRMNVTPPSQVEAGSYTLRLLAQPTDGSEAVVISSRIAVRESPAYHIQAPTGLQMAAGETRNLTLDVENRGNVAGEVALTASSNLTQTSATPASLTLAPGESRPVRLSVDALDTGSEPLRLVADPGGQATVDLTVGSVDLSLELVSTDPSPPQVGEHFRGVVAVTNQGDVPAREVDVALMSGPEVLASEEIGFLGPGNTVTISLSVEELSTLEDLALVVDPGNRYSQETGSDDAITLSQQDAPMAPVAVVLLVGLLVSLVARRTRR